MELENDESAKYFLNNNRYVNHSSILRKFSIKFPIVQMNCDQFQRFRLRETSGTTQVKYFLFDALHNTSLHKKIK